jgi:hypothetical protein
MRPVCKKCGSKDVDVKADAYVDWDNLQQTWSVSFVGEKGAVCEACGGETELVWIGGIGESEPIAES